MNGLQASLRYFKPVLWLLPVCVNGMAVTSLLGEMESSSVATPHLQVEAHLLLLPSGETAVSHGHFPFTTPTLTLLTDLWQTVGLWLLLLLLGFLFMWLLIKSQPSYPFPQLEP